MPDKQITYGSDAVNARYRGGDDDPAGGGNYVVAETLDGSGNVVNQLLKWDDTAGEWVSGGPVNLNGNDVTSAGALDADSIRTGGVTDKTSNREVWSGDATVTVDPSGGGDYTTLQTAVNSELPYINNGIITFDLQPGNYGEDVTIQNVVSGGRDSSTAIRIEGDPNSPGDYTGLSFGVKWCSARVDIAGVTLDREHPFSVENNGLIAYQSVSVRLGNVAFGNITKGVTAYRAVVEIDSVDFGSDLLTAVRTKHYGIVWEQGVNSEQITGSPEVAYDANNGFIIVDTDSSLSGTSKQYVVGQGQIFDDTGAPRGQYRIPAGETFTMSDFAAGASEHITPGTQFTESVGTSATAIHTLVSENGQSGFGGLIIVHGGATDASSYWTDLVLMTRGSSANRIGDAEDGTPDTRSYNANGSDLELTMGGGEYNIITKAFSMRAI